MNLKNKLILKNAGFKCAKCNYYSPLGTDLKVNKNVVLCSICNTFAPSVLEEFDKYIKDKVQSNTLDSFRRFGKTENNLKKAMVSTAKKGKPVSRPAFGYNMVGGNLIPAQNSDEVREIFTEFSRGLSLNQVARNHHLSVNGIKKILKNFTYIGKVKFDNQIMQGTHNSIISAELFNDVQNRFERLSKTN